MAIQKYADEVMADGPSGYWRLGDQPGSTTADDATGHGHVGQVTGGVIFGLPGFHGGDTAALFDGRTGRIMVSNADPRHEDLNPTRITMEAKIRWDGPTAVQQRILEKQSYVGIPQYGLSVLPDGHAYVELRMRVSNLTIVSATSTDLVALGAETHVAATYDGRSIRFYINGKPSGEKLINSASEVDIDVKDNVDDEVALVIGDRYDPPGAPQRTFNGLIDEVAIYPTALSEERIRAHYQAQFAEEGILQYAAKLVCGKSDGEVVAPGVYFTAVNVHNPMYTTVGFGVKIAVALPGLKPGPVSRFYKAELGPDQALEIDCPDIFNPEIFRFDEPLQTDFLKGFVVIESKVELDVVAVYTAASTKTQVETLHMERVPARRLEASVREV
jgi:Concanavalin A-like lectin/glucanases superfamily